MDGGTIAILVLVTLTFLMTLELYRNLLNIMAAQRPEATPPTDLMFGQPHELFGSRGKRRRR